MIMKVNIFDDVQELVKALADEIAKSAKEAIDARGQFNFVLSGGNSPKILYKLLASDSYRSEIDWGKTYFFFGDERFVPKEDKQRNSLMAKETLFNPLGIPDSHIFLVDTSGSPAEAAMRYNGVIVNHFQQKDVHFDFVLLGLGDNAHTASLFPETPVLKEQEAVVQCVYVEEIDATRITMSAPLINEARKIAFLVFGEDKAEAVEKVIKDQEASPQKYPAMLIAPKEGKLLWFLDAKAGALVKDFTN